MTGCAIIEIGLPRNPSVAVGLAFTVGRAFTPLALAPLLVADQPARFA